jgi:uncharacterized NAD(P)/FAD-binding protein YdhS
LRIVLVEKGSRFARGLAYGTHCQRHLLNVPAALMSALPEESSHFLNWLQARNPSSHAGTYAPRPVYGDYLEELLSETARNSAAAIELIRDEVVDLREMPDENRIVVQTTTGRLVIADRVVLALGNQLPSDPPSVDCARVKSRYISNPWGRAALDGLKADEPIALIGSGLTSADVIAEAQSVGHRGVIYALSRHGLLPCSHQAAVPRPHFNLASQRTTARALLRTVRDESAKAQLDGGDWRSVIDGIRPVTQSLWRSLENRERQRFVRHLASHWDVHRHRVAPEIAALLESRIKDNRLVVIAGRLLAIEEREEAVLLAFQRRGQLKSETLAVGRIINCTGPARDIRRTESRLVQSLLATGIGRPGPLALGLDVSEYGALIRNDGLVNDRFFAIGPLLKDQLWETTAVRELRTQAAELARWLLATV